MTQRECKACGAPLKSIGFGKYICEYCGSLYEDDFGTLRFIEVAREPCQTISARCEIPYELREFRDNEGLTKLTLRQLSQQLAEGLMGYMKLYVSEDPCRMATIVRGDVRVIPPSQRYDGGVFGR